MEISKETKKKYRNFPEMNGKDFFGLIDEPNMSTLVTKGILFAKKKNNTYIYNVFHYKNGPWLLKKGCQLKELLDFKNSGIGWYNDEGISITEKDSEFDEDGLERNFYSNLNSLDSTNLNLAINRLKAKKAYEEHFSLLLKNKKMLGELIPVELVSKLVYSQKMEYSRSFYELFENYILDISHKHGIEIDEVGKIKMSFRESINKRFDQVTTSVKKQLNKIIKEYSDNKTIDSE